MTPSDAPAAAPQAVEIIDSAPEDLCAGRGEGLGRSVRTGESDDLMAGNDQLRERPPSRSNPTRG